MALPRTFLDRCEAEPDRIFLRFGRSELSREQMLQRMLAVTGFLQARGLEEGSTIGAMLGNRPEFLHVWLGANLAGMVMVPYNGALRGDDLAYQLEHSRTSILFVESALLPEVDEVLAARRGLTVVAVGGGSGGRFVGFDEVASTPAGTVSNRVKDGELMEIIYTSGTTNRPKGVVWRYGMMGMLAETLCRHCELDRNDRLMVVLPLFHGNAQLSTAMTVVGDASMLLVPRFSASGFWDTAREGGATEVNLLGPLVTMLFNQPPREDDADNPIRISLSAATPAPLHEAFEQRFGLTVVEAYGLTETGINTANPVDRGRRKIGTIGLPLPYNEVAILDGDLEPQSPGVPGEICVRPVPGVEELMTIEYLDDPEATSELWRGGWLHTGDEGVMDEEGFFTFLDRLKDVIRRRGENISSQQVENVLVSHPAVALAAVVGIPSELGEEEVLALIVPSAEVTPEELAAFCLARLADFKVPEWYRFVDDLPRTPTGRVKKALLRRRPDIAQGAVKLDIKTVKEGEA